jgi:hypothetical protein
MSQTANQPILLRHRRVIGRVSFSSYSDTVRFKPLPRLCISAMTISKLVRIGIFILLSHSARQADKVGEERVL